MKRKSIEIYYILMVASAFLLGVAAGIYLTKKTEVATDVYVYACLVASIMVNLINLVFFQRRYLAFLKSLETKFSYTDQSDSSPNPRAEQ